MTWTKTASERVWEPFVADERTTLEGFLDEQRTTLLWKRSGLTGRQNSPVRMCRTRTQPTLHRP